MSMNMMHEFMELTSISWFIDLFFGLFALETPS